jgi:Zn-dependent peptidase ImmA (M78 family)
MMVSLNHLEGIAARVLEETGTDVPVEAKRLAKRYGMTLHAWMKATGKLVGGTQIYYPAKARHTRQQFRIAHEVAHKALRAHGVDHSDPDEGCTHEAIESAANYLAGALLLPREAFLRHLGETEWDLFRMMDLHPNVSAQAICLRMTELSPAATASVWDAGKCHRAYGAPHEELAAIDRELADLVLGAEEPVRGDASAWPILDGRFRRVCVVRRAA